jgi:DNA/RNA endonuclease G (NUC1)
MHKRLVAAVACAIAVSSAAVAETIVVNDQVQVADSQTPRPKRGSTMGDVEKQFGAPMNRHATVGTPPITRWDYNGFSVVFERDRVIDAPVTASVAAAAPSDAAPAPQQ